jgi:hypothetical protein
LTTTPPLSYRDLKTGQSRTAISAPSRKSLERLKGLITTVSNRLTLLIASVGDR